MIKDNKEHLLTFFSKNFRENKTGNFVANFHLKKVT